MTSERTTQTATATVGEVPIPDLTMGGMDDPYGLSTAVGRPPTVGQLAARVRDLAGRPADWWHRVGFDPAGPVRVRLEPAEGKAEPAGAAAGAAAGAVAGAAAGAAAGGSAGGSAGIEVWLTTWPPGHRTRVHGHGVTTKVSVVIAGELVEVALTEEGAGERPLRANRIKVHGSSHLHELANPGPAFAVTLHAQPAVAERPAERPAGRPLSDGANG